MDFWNAERKQYQGSLDRIYLNNTGMLQDLCRTMNSVGVKPVAMMWNIAGVRMTQTFIEMGLLQEPLMCECTVFGPGFEQFGHPATVKGLQALLDFFPEGANWQWMVSSMGVNPFPLNAFAIANGGHFAVGLGDYAFPSWVIRPMPTSSAAAPSCHTPWAAKSRPRRKRARSWVSSNS